MDDRHRQIHLIKIASLAGACLCAAALAWSAKADDIDEMQHTLNSQICPSNRTQYKEIWPREYCPTSTICVDATRNGTPDCGGGGIVGYELDCQREVQQKNDVIRNYNGFVGMCSRGTGTPSSSSARTKNDLSAKIEAAKQKAQGAEARQAEQLGQLRRDQRAAIADYQARIDAAEAERRALAEEQARAEREYRAWQQQRAYEQQRRYVAYMRRLQARQQFISNFIAGMNAFRQAYSSYAPVYSPPSRPAPLPSAPPIGGGGGSSCDWSQGACGMR